MIASHGLLTYNSPRQILSERMNGIEASSPYFLTTIESIHNDTGGLATDWITRVAFSCEELHPDKACK